jgi:DNA recombination protein RmuC
VNSLPLILLAAAAILLAASLIIVIQKGAAFKGGAAGKEGFERLGAALESLRRDVLDSQRQGVGELRAEQANEGQRLRAEMGDGFAKLRAEQSENMTALRTEIGSKLAGQAVQNEQKLENIRSTMETRIKSLQDDNAKHLDTMRQTVDEKLQKTLEERIGQSFRNVSEQLAQVYKGLGEMQALASDVGDLKKVLSNVKTKGTMGEIQLEAILEEILPAERYEKQYATIEGSGNRVDFAIKLPGQGDDPVWLPIDAKFPTEDYYNLASAYEGADPAAVELAGKQLDAKIKQFAKSIHDKYVMPPNTTEFAIMFLPIEGLYAEVVRRGLVEALQSGYKISIAGPTTMAALLNSLQMGFRTLAIQKRSGEVWKTLGAIKTEFASFQAILENYQGRMQKANEDLDKLIGVRTRAINRKLREVEALPGEESVALLQIGNDGIGPDGDE